MQVYFLGTAGAVPTPHKNPACIMVRRGSDTLLFDCGEGAQQQMMRTRTGFGVDAIFITHWHADHYLGVPGLLETLSFIERRTPLPIYGPAWVYEFVDCVLNLARNNLKFQVVPRQLAHGDIVEFSGYHVRAFASRHGVSGLGYILKEDGRPGRFDREEAVRLRVPSGPLFGRLQRGETVTIESDNGLREIQPSQVLGPPRPGRCVVYTGDTRPDCQNWKAWASGADLLIHDATFDDTESDRAREVFHATAGEAGAVAREIDARTLALVHISSRYTSTGSHIHDAKQHFDGEVIAPDDGAMIEVPFRE
jgi:ribonuclease Z